LVGEVYYYVLGLVGVGEIQDQGGDGKGVRVGEPRKKN